MAVLVVVCLALLTSGCRATYVARLAYEQVRYLARAVPISELIETTDDDERRRRLGLVLAARSFAARNGLDPGGSFEAVSDTSEAAPFHVVTAAHVRRLRPYTWWYPVVGAMPYRGYFDREAAENFARTLDQEELDVRIVEASAYSTLGWFDDPLPSGLLERGDGFLVSTVLHELVHQNFFAPGDVAFNETLATSIGLRLAADFLEERGDTELAEKIRRHHGRWLGRGEFFDLLAGNLEEFLEGAEARELSIGEIREGRAAIYEEAQAEFVAKELSVENDLFLQSPMDNATFLSLYRYASHAPAIDHFVASWPDLPEAFAELRRRIDDGEDLHDSLYAEVGKTAPIGVKSD